jgi:uncharacterized membrane protein
MAPANDGDKGWPWRRHRHGPFVVAATAALVSLPVLIVLLPRLSAALTANVFFIVYLGLMALRIPHLDADRFEASGQTNDEPAPIILSVTLLAAIAALVTLFEALNDDQRSGAFDVTAGFAAVILGWFSIHTMFALHYAHLYWRPGETKGKCAGGLDFPGTDRPGAYDFLYFGYVIGMTAQTSDVAITRTDMRKINLLHSVVSFFFNTVLVAAAVNAVVSLAS